LNVLNLYLHAPDPAALAAGFSSRLVSSPKSLGLPFRHSIAGQTVWSLDRMATCFFANSFVRDEAPGSCGQLSANDNNAASISEKD
jgi:hypothetical protein